MTIDELAEKWEAEADAMALEAIAEPSTTYRVAKQARVDQLRRCAQQLRQAAGRHSGEVACSCCGKVSHVEISGDEQDLPCQECGELLTVQFVANLTAS